MNLSNTFVQTILIPTVLDDVMGADGKFTKVRAMIDPGSQSSFVSEVLIKKLKLPITSSHTRVNCICSQESTVVKDEATLNIS